MKLLFLTRSNVDSLDGSGIYIDLLNHFRKHGHEVYIVSPTERRYNKKTQIIQEANAQILNIRTLNLRNTNIIEKGLGEVSLEYQYLRGIKKYFGDVKFDLILYSTPPITLTKVIKYVKKRDRAVSYLLLKDIFPQNAVDMNMLRKNSFLHKMFLKKETELYALSDTIGCMSEANKDYVLKNNPEIGEEKVEVNPNSISPNPIHYSQDEKNEIREKYNLPLNKTIFVYGGNLGKPQGLDFLLETIDELKNPQAYILVVGKGTQFDYLSEWFEENRPKNAKLLAGLPKKEYDLLLGSCDVGLIFLHKDFTIPNFPSRLLSYLEMKKPVLAATDPNTDIGETIEKAKCGYWVHSGELKTMLKTIDDMCNQELLDKMEENAWDLLEREFMVKRSYNLIETKVTDV